MKNAKFYYKDLSCDRKVRYLTYRHAKNDAMALSKKAGEKLEAYHCKFCSGWHVGHITIKRS